MLMKFVKRDRAWRRNQGRKVINKRLNILKIWYSGTSYDGRHDHFRKSREYKFPGYLKKWNFTCGCACCKIEKYFEKRDREQTEKRLRKLASNEYGSSFYF